MFGPSRIISLATEADTDRFGAAMAEVIKAGDTILLEGDIGAGKSAFARALIRAKASAEIEVPSPTFTLVQTYECDAVTIWHCDLYRLSHADEVFELGLDAAFETDVCLIEWPDRLANLVPPNALTLLFAAHDDHHTVTFSPNVDWAKRLAHLHD